MSGFEGLSDDVRGRLTARGIDADASLAGFLAEVREAPPEPLLRILGIAPVLTERQIDGLTKGNSVEGLTLLRQTEGGR